MRRVVIGGLLIGLLALAWYVDSLLARTLWVNNFVAETRSGDWYTGWPILWHAWPLALVGILVGGSFALLGVGLVYGWANEGDQEREMERLRQVAIEAEQRAERLERRNAQLVQDLDRMCRPVPIRTNAGEPDPSAA